MLIYSKKTDDEAERLLRMIEAVVSENKLSIYRTINGLSRGLRKPRNGLNIAILLVSSKEDLQNIIYFRDLLWDIKIILILPDSDPDTIAKAHLLRPRFLSYCDSDFQDVAAVLSRMIVNLDISKKQGRHAGLKYQ
jgi:hypothetical protein